MNKIINGVDIEKHCYFIKVKNIEQSLRVINITYKNKINFLCLVVVFSYVDEGCDFQPYIQSVEYVLNNFDVESSSSRHDFFVSTSYRKSIQIK